MLARLLLICAVGAFSSSAFAGIIAIGGTNANQYPEVMTALKEANELGVKVKDFDRLSARIGDKGTVSAEVVTPQGEVIRRDFIKVFANGQGEIVDRNVEIKLAPVGSKASPINFFPITPKQP